MEGSVFNIKFSNNDKMFSLIDGLINAIEKAKKFVIDSNVEWETVSIYDSYNDELVYKMSFQKDMFSNGGDWSTIPNSEW